MKLKILVTAGDGIGPEVTNEAVAVLKETAALGGHDFTFAEKRIGGVAIVQDGTPLPEDTLKAALASDAVLLGAVGGNEFNSLPPDKRPEAGLLAIRAALGGFANLRPCFSFKELTVNSPLAAEIVEGTDILFVRELLGGAYFGKPREWNKEKGVGYNTMVYTRDEVARVARIAFQLGAEAPQEADQRGQGQRARGFAALARDGERGGEGVPRRDAGAPICGRDGDAHDESAARLRRGADGESVRRHSERRVRRDYRLAGHAALGDHRRQGEFV